MQQKITYGFDNALNYSRDDFHEDGHATTIRLLLPFNRSLTGRFSRCSRAVVCGQGSEVQRSRNGPEKDPAYGLNARSTVGRRQG